MNPRTTIDKAWVTALNNLRPNGYKFNPREGGSRLKARAFKYVRAGSLKDALAAFARADADCIYIAGGQSLVPALALRLQAPDVLIDIGRLPELTGITLKDGVLRVGALTRHAQMLSSPEIAHHAPLLKEAAPFVAHPAIRNKGTFGGTIALADPAAEFPAITLALDATFEIAGSNGVRMSRAETFFRGLFDTDLGSGEIITAIHIPAFGPNDRCAFHELARRRGDYALVGAGVQATMSKDRVDTIRIAFLSVGPTPMRARNAEGALIGGPLSYERIEAAQHALAQDLDPGDTEETSAAMRMHLARVLLGRLLARLARTEDFSERPCL